MGKLIVSDNIPFSLADWKREEITRIWAGCECIMALTADGRVLQKITDADLAARTQSWTRIREIAVSTCIPGVCIGLVQDGTCLIAKRPVRKFSHRFEQVNNAVKSWHDIRQVAASDALFALDSQGKVHYVNLSAGYDDYRAVSQWEKVVRLVAGSQNAVFGITGDGRVLCAGSNCLHGPHGNLQETLQGMTGVKDLYATGSECEKITLIFSDGRIAAIGGDAMDITSCSTFPITASHPLVGVLRDDQGYLHFDMYTSPVPKAFRKLEKYPVTDFAAGFCQCADPFVLALTDNPTGFLSRLL